MGNAVQPCQMAPAGLDVGTFVTECGFTDMVGHENSLRAVMAMGGIEPWSAKDLVKENLERQSHLATRSPLRHVKVREGVSVFREHVGYFDHRLSKVEFVRACRRTLESAHASGGGGAQDEEILGQVFDSMDFDGDGMLNMGEWASGLCVFFQGTQAESIHCVFNLLDSDGDCTLSLREFRAFLEPYVKIMTPPKAAALRPLLAKKAAEDILREIDANHNGTISEDELVRWIAAGNNIVDFLAMTIEKEVYAIYLKSQKATDYPHKAMAAMW